MNDILQFYLDPHNKLGDQTLVFIALSLIPIVLSIVIGVSTGVLVLRNAKLSFIAINASNLMRAIPVLAVLFLLVPVLHVGFTPAATALTVLGIPPILINTYTGLRGIDPALIESARGMGMTNWQIIRRVQAPLVLPVIAAGIRTAAIQIVATAPLGGLIGAGGWGDYIIDGVNSLNTTEILAGSILVAALAMCVELGMNWLERRATPRGLRGIHQPDKPPTRS